MSKSVFTVGICGGSASGKSVLSDYLVKGLGGNAVVFCQDWYYKDNAGLSDAEAEKINFDHPGAIEFPLLLADLDRLRDGLPIQAPVYEYVSHSRTGVQKVEPRPVVIVEGLFVLQNRKIRNRLDLSVYIDVPSDERLLRRVRRDVSERRVALEETLRLYESFVRPMHEEFIEPSARYADHRWRQLDDETFRQEILADVQSRAAVKV